MSATTSLYRKPMTPGYLGTYNWRSTLLGLLLFITTNIITTQHIASHFDYQPALGAPFFQVSSIRIYAPYKWFIWILLFGNSLNPAILYDSMVLDPVLIAPWPSSMAAAVMQHSAEQSRTRATPGTSPRPNAIESCRRSGRSVRTACPYGPWIDCTRRASKRRCHFGCLASFPSSRPHDASVLSWAPLNPLT